MMYQRGVCFCISPLDDQWVLYLPPRDPMAKIPVRTVHMYIIQDRQHIDSAYSDDDDM